MQSADNVTIRNVVESVCIWWYRIARSPDCHDMKYHMPDKLQQYSDFTNVRSICWEKIQKIMTEWKPHDEWSGGEIAER